MPEAVIIDAVRTPIGNFRGSLASVRADELAAISLRAIIERTGIDPAIVEEIYLGCANQAGEDNRNVARMATLLADFPVEVAAMTLNRLCASGLNAVNQAARAIKLREGDVFFIKDGSKLNRKYKPIPRDVAAEIHLLLPWDESKRIARQEIKKEFSRITAAQMSPYSVNLRERLIKRIDKKFEQDNP